MSLEGTTGVPRNGALSNSWFDCVLLFILDVVIACGDSLLGSSVKVGTTQRRLARPLRVTTRTVREV